MSTYKLYNNDSYKQIENFLSEGLMVDHIITDPPYNISQDNNFSTMKNPRNGVDFGSWDRGMFDLFSWIPLYTKILNPNGSMVIFCSYRYLSHIIDVLESDRCKMIVKDVIIWQKRNPMPRNTNRRYVQDMEFAIWAVKKNSKWVFNKQLGVPYNRAFFVTSTVAGAEKLGHPTQKSLELMKKLMFIHTNPGELVMDPFMGSGSTGAAALELNRNFIGVEMSPKYFIMAKNRLENLSLRL